MKSRYSVRRTILDFSTEMSEIKIMSDCLGFRVQLTTQRTTYDLATTYDSVQNPVGTGTVFV